MQYTISQVKSVTYLYIINRNTEADATTVIYKDFMPEWVCLTGPILLCLDSFLYMHYCLRV